MGRGRKARTTVAPTVVGATPATEDQPFVISIQQRQAAQEAEGAADAATHQRLPAKLKPTNFFTAPPRTEIFEERDDDAGGDGADDGQGRRDKRFRKKASAAAPANLGEISGMIWAKTSTRRGGARDPAAAQATRVGHVMEEMAQLDEGGEGAALMSAEGFKAYVDDCIWGVRAPGEADDAPLDVEDVIQVKDRLQQVWANWRKLTPQQQRSWADKQLAKQGATAVKRAGGKAAPKVHGSVWSAESAAALKAVGAYSSRRKPDGWAFSRAPAHTARNGKLPAAELQALQDQQQQEEEQDASAQQGGSGDQKRKQKKRSRKQAEADAQRTQELEKEVAEAQWRRAAALRRSRPALLAEMAVWEQEAEEVDDAAAAGISVEELRQQRKEEEAAEAAAAEAAAAEADKQEQEDPAEQEGNEEEEGAAGGGAGAVRGRGRGRAKAPAAAAAAKPAGGRASKKSRAAAAGDEGGASGEAAGPSSSKPRAKKATAAAAATGAGAASGGAKAGRPRKAAVAKAPACRKQAADPYELEEDEADESDEDAPRPEEEAELARALSDGDDSDADASSQDASEDEDDEEDDSEEEEEEVRATAAAPPSKQRFGVNSKPGLKPMGAKAALTAAAAALAKRAAAVLGAGAGVSKQPAKAAAAAAGPAAAAAAREGAGRRGRKAAPAAAAAEGGEQASSPAKTKEGGSGKGGAAQGAKAGSRKRPAAAAAAAEPELTGADEEAGAAAAAGGAGRSKRRKQQAPTSTAVAGSPVRRSGRQAQGGAGDDEGPAVSGAGPTTAARPGRATPAGTAQAAQIEQKEKELFSNTRRGSSHMPSFSRGDSPGVVPPGSAHGKKGGSRLAKRKAAA